MEWLESWNKAVNYIEGHLESEISMHEVAKLVCCSSFRFQRMFSYMTNLSLTEYIRRRKMTRAAAELQHGAKVVDVAFRYGYESPTAFNRAFRSVHGVSPSMAKKEGIVLKAYPPISFHITIKGEAEMKYRIEKKDAFRIVGYHKKINGMEGNFQEIPAFWEKTEQAGGIPKLCVLMDGEPKAMLGVTCSAENCCEDYYIAVASSAPASVGMEEYMIPAAMWAVFECVGPIEGPKECVMGDLQKRIFTEWLPTSGYAYADAPDVEVYPQGDLTAKDYHCEVWLPVVKK